MLWNLVAAIPFHQQDFVTWDGLKAEKLELSDIWNTTRSVGNGQFWLNAIWHPLSIPKGSIMIWLALKNRLLTKDRMISFGMHVDPGCIFCNGQNESIQHLLIECPYFLDILTPSPSPLSQAGYQEFKV